MYLNFFYGVYLVYLSAVRFYYYFFHMTQVPTLYITLVTHYGWYEEINIETTDGIYTRIHLSNYGHMYHALRLVLVGAKQIQKGFLP